MVIKFADIPWESHSKLKPTYLSRAKKIAFKQLLHVHNFLIVNHPNFSHDFLISFIWQDHSCLHINLSFVPVVRFYLTLIHKLPCLFCSLVVFIPQLGYLVVLPIQYLHDHNGDTTLLDFTFCVCFLLYLLFN